MSDVKVTVGGVTILVDPSSQTLRTINVDGAADGTDAPVGSEVVTEPAKEVIEDDQVMLESTRDKTADTVEEIKDVTGTTDEKPVDASKEVVDEVKEVFEATKEKVAEVVEAIKEKIEDVLGEAEKQTPNTADDVKNTAEKDKIDTGAVATSETADEFKDAEEPQSVRRSSVFKEVETGTNPEGTAVVEISEIPTAEESAAGAEPVRTLETVPVDDASTLNEGAQSAINRKSTSVTFDKSVSEVTVPVKKAGRKIDKARAKIPNGIWKLILGSSLVDVVKTKLLELAANPASPPPLPQGDEVENVTVK
ncbi:hypothetical protein EJ05DRAFT_477782 [Pseudovirgaria hyperparasitica]|uniref:Uncharacterized protein n=1 Tax=Pseudovirgaria hyperparasitica TaxID=470096 RepID=A0A6A6W291_9PEZI|nr:uncharacterized protein EJ05DRAFT_477782 [Pseudovirgaria hyperparasitica]KAF2756683.1 hypothetical protein EJ05DRAFT_477782 [Pseudovirgaria hyperparasitica]